MLRLSSSHFNSNSSPRIRNVVKIPFNQLYEAEIDLFRADPISCKKCRAVLNWTHPAPGTSWTCLFCNMLNHLKEGQQLPTTTNCTVYLIEEAPINPVDLRYPTACMKYIIFCTDISGSMIAAYKIPSNIRLPTDLIREERQRQEQEELERAGICNKEELDRLNRSLSTEEKYVAQLEIFQNALVNSIAKVEALKPDKRVGLITFNNMVNIVGDGVMRNILIEESVLDSERILEKSIADVPEFCNIGRVPGKLREQILRLNCSGETALGPALYMSIHIASRVRGSQVVLCTDGVANRGVGSLVEPVSPESNKFYNNLAEYAKDKGVVVSIITVKDNNSKLDCLGTVANTTGGSISIVDPSNPNKVEEYFTSSVKQTAIATQMKALLIVPNEYYIKDYKNPSKRDNLIEIEIGNVDVKSEISFEICSKEGNERIRGARVPIQLQLNFTSEEGRKLQKVITSLEEVTDRESLVESKVDKCVLASHAVRVFADLDKNGLDTSDIENLINSIKLMKPDVDLLNYEEFDKKIRKLKKIREDVTNIPQPPQPAQSPQPQQTPQAPPDSLSHYIRASMNHDRAASYSDITMKNAIDTNMSVYNKSAKTNSDSLMKQNSENSSDKPDKSNKSDK